MPCSPPRSEADLVLRAAFAHLVMTVMSKATSDQWLDGSVQYQYVPVISVQWARFECIDLLDCLWMTRCIPSCRYEVRIVPENTREIRGHCIPRWWRMAEGPVNNIQASKRSTNKTVSDRDPCSKFITSFSGYYILGLAWSGPLSVTAFTS